MSAAWLAKPLVDALAIPAINAYMKSNPSAPRVTIGEVTISVEGVALDGKLPASTYVRKDGAFACTGDAQVPATSPSLLLLLAPPTYMHMHMYMDVGVDMCVCNICMHMRLAELDKCGMAYPTFDAGSPALVELMLPMAIEIRHA